MRLRLVVAFFLGVGSIATYGAEVGIRSTAPLSGFVDLAFKDATVEVPDTFELLINPYFRGVHSTQLEIEGRRTALDHEDLTSLLSSGLAKQLADDGRAAPTDSDKWLGDFLQFLTQNYGVPEIDPQSDRIYLPVAMDFGLSGVRAFGVDGATAIFRFAMRTVVNLSEPDSEDIQSLRGYPHQLAFSFAPLEWLEVIHPTMTDDEFRTYIAEVDKRKGSEKLRWGDNRTAVFIFGGSKNLSCNRLQQDAGKGLAVSYSWLCKYRLYYGKNS